MQKVNNSQPSWSCLPIHSSSTKMFDWLNDFDQDDPVQTKIFESDDHDDQDQKWGKQQIVDMYNMHKMFSKYLTRTIWRNSHPSWSCALAQRRQWRRRRETVLIFASSFFIFSNTQFCLVRNSYYSLPGLIILSDWISEMLCYMCYWHKKRIKEQHSLLFV